MVETTLPEGITLTESGYKVFRLNGQKVTGFDGSNGRYYEQVITPDNKEVWFVFLDDM